MAFSSSFFVCLRTRNWKNDTGTGTGTGTVTDEENFHSVKMNEHDGKWASKRAIQREGREMDEWEWYRWGCAFCVIQRYGAGFKFDSIKKCSLILQHWRVRTNNTTHKYQKYIVRLIVQHSNDLHYASAYFNDEFVRNVTVCVCVRYWCSSLFSFGFIISKCENDFELEE